MHVTLKQHMSHKDAIGKTLYPLVGQTPFAGLLQLEDFPIARGVRFRQHLRQRIAGALRAIAARQRRCIQRR